MKTESIQKGGVMMNGETGSPQGKTATQPPATKISLYPLILLISLLRVDLSQKSGTSFIHTTRIYHFPGVFCTTNLEMSESI